MPPEPEMLLPGCAGHDPGDRERELPPGIATDVTALRNAERRALDSEAAMAQVIDAFEGFLYLSQRGRVWLFVRGQTRQVTGWSSEELLSGEVPWQRVVHPDDWPLVEIEAENRDRIPAYVSNSTYRIVRRDGETRWIQEVVRPTDPGPDGEPRWLGSILDITQRKLAELAQAQWEALRSRFIGSVIEAQEQERARVGRELHDGIGQALAGLRVRIAALAQRTPALAGELGELRAICAEASDDLARLAKGLRPAAIDHLGVGAALARLVHDQQAVHGLQIDLHLDARIDCDRIEAPLGTAIYRIVQEALTNIVRHARARQASIVVDGRPRALRLLIEDDGIGFDRRSRSAAQGPAGLGLHGIEERAALLGGTVRLESQAGSGTLLIVDLPWDG